MAPAKKRKHSGHTLTVIWIWLALIPLSFILQGILSLTPDTFPGHGLIIPQSTLVTFAGMGTFAYLGLEYGAQILQNTKLPKGQGSVENLRLYKTMTYVWLAYYLVALAISAFINIQPAFPLTDLATYAGAVMLGYVAGQKGSKISLGVGPAPVPQSEPAVAPQMPRQASTAASPVKADTDAPGGR